VKSLQIDHISPGPSEIAPQAILYFDPSSTSSVPLLEYLERHARNYAAFRYIVRYKPSLAAGHESRRKVPLSGYGVELALKKTDYLVVDDRAAPVQKAHVPKDKQAAVRAGPFDAELGGDPWSELSTPLRPTEIAGMSTLLHADWQRLIHRCPRQSRRLHRLLQQSARSLTAHFARLSKVLCCPRTARQYI
jgi:UDP-glucose:glycoprotein glucosyltransferase